MVQFYPWFKLYFPLFWGMAMYDNEFKTKENKIQTKNTIEPQHIPLWQSKQYLLTNMAK